MGSIPRILRRLWLARSSNPPPRVVTEEELKSPEELQIQRVQEHQDARRSRRHKKKRKLVVTEKAAAHPLPEVESCPSPQASQSNTPAAVQDQNVPKTQVVRSGSGSAMDPSAVSDDGQCGQGVSATEVQPGTPVVVVHPNAALSPTTAVLTEPRDADMAHDCAGTATLHHLDVAGPSSATHPAPATAASAVDDINMQDHEVGLGEGGNACEVLGGVAEPSTSSSHPPPTH
ncbi:hypothetical protein NUW54_g14510 [Trametes sanguinea]|uniref:Uncharacterized protein n=1 Tax=Trametes sanguinea TaxID=158606 RepID=A0ACC1MBT1_9APHY|nr:hypothetical protein NUW54_g14510 [Trametes sanguinea]